MGSVVRRLVLNGQADGEPALFDFGVGISRRVIVSIDESEQLNSDFVHVGSNRFVEDNFQVAIETEVVLIISRARITPECQIRQSKILSVSSLRSREVKSTIWWQFRLKQPPVPIRLSQNLISCNWIIVHFNPLAPSFNQVNIADRGEEPFLNPKSEE